MVRKITSKFHLQKSILEKIKDDIIKLPCASEDDKTKITEHWFNGINIFGKNFYY